LGCRVYVEFLSLFTAFCYGLSAVLVRKGMMDSNPLTGALVSALVQVLVISGILLGSPPQMLDLAAIAYFVASGLLASTLGRLCNFMSIERLGVPVSASIIGSSPLFSYLFAVLLVGEEVAATTLTGIVLVVVGVALTSGGDYKGDFGLMRYAIVLPVLAAVFYGASSAVRKVGLMILPEATLGALVGAASSLISFAVYLAVARNSDAVWLSGSSLGYFTISGVVVSLGWLSMFNALVAGKVSVVSTLIGTNPLFSLVLSWLMLRGSEGFGWRVVAGCIATVSGAALITLF
jgi:DME family drug/metabolite transporter